MKDEVASPRLAGCPPSLPPEAYLGGWWAAERARLWPRAWVCVGRLEDQAPGTMRRVGVGGADALLLRPSEGAPVAYHNVCPHRGAELCAEGERPVGRLIACPYHAWSFRAEDGRLVSTAFARPTADFEPEAHGLLRLGLRVWRGFVFLRAQGEDGEPEADLPFSTLDAWPLEALRVGHRHVAELLCDWKLFWENYSECLHCPGVHPGLSARVPVYREGLMAWEERAGWDGARGLALEEGAESWTPSGRLCGAPFPGLSAQERGRGHVFLTFWPSLYLVAHPDHVRAVRVEAVAPGRTRLTAEWLFPEETMAQPGFDAAHVASFARTVMEEDGRAVEMNQRGLSHPAFRGGRLMPEEFEVRRFHDWVRERIA